MENQESLSNISEIENKLDNLSINSSSILDDKINISTSNTVANTPSKEPSVKKADTKIKEEKLKIGYCFDERMLLHKDYSFKHQERPERAMAIYMNLIMKNITQNLIRIPSDISTETDITSVHTKEYYDSVYNLQFKKQDPSEKRDIFETKKTLKERDTYDNYYTYESAMFAVGSLISTCKYIMTDKVDHAFAIIRPPGHHADTSNCHGFCVFNSVAISTEYIKKNYPGKKIAIVDWDVHHGDGTQKIFYNQDNPLFISIHRHDGGKFYPGVTGFMTEFGEDKGKGYNVNIPLDTKISISNAPSCIGDAEYIYLFDNIIMPILCQYNPDIIIISCGFDAGENDISGWLKCTPIAYAYMTKKLMNMKKKIIFALEGGYTLDTLQRCSECVIRTLLGEDKPFNGIMIKNYKEINIDNDNNYCNKLFTELNLDRIINNYREIFKPIPYVVTQLNNIIENHSQFWMCLKDKKIEIPNNSISYLRNQNDLDIEILKEYLLSISEEDFLKKYDDFIIFKVGKKIINENTLKISNDDEKNGLNKYYRRKIKSMRTLLNELSFNIESVKFTKLRANATKMTQYLNWKRDEMKYDLDSFFVSRILTLFFQHLNIKNDFVIKQFDCFIDKIKNLLEEKIDLFNCNLILCPVIIPPKEEEEKKDDTSVSSDTSKSSKQSIKSKIKKAKKNKENVIFDFYLDGVKKTNVTLYDESNKQNNQKNFLNGLISIKEYIKENVMI